MEFIIQFIVALFATLSFAVIFSAPKKELFYCGFTGALGWIIYYIMVQFDMGVVFPSLIATLCLTIMARIFAAARSMPVTVYLLSGIFPLVPGAGIFYTAYYLFTNDRALSSSKGIETFEVAGAIAKKLGLELQIDDMDFDAALLSVQQGKADIAMAGVTVTDERKNVMDFSDSYATGIQSIIVPEGSDIASPDDLAGKMIGTQRGTTGYIYCSDDFGDDAVVAYDDGLTAVQALNNGQVDAVVIDNAPAKEFVAANPGLVLLDTSYAEEDYAIGMAKGSSLEAAVNAALEELKADGTLQSIVDKYITAE